MLNLVRRLEGVCLRRPRLDRCRGLGPELGIVDDSLARFRWRSSSIWPISQLVRTSAFCIGCYTTRLLVVWIENPRPKSYLWWLFRTRIGLCWFLAIPQTSSCLCFCSDLYCFSSQCSCFGRIAQSDHKRFHSCWRRVSQNYCSWHHHLLELDRSVQALRAPCPYLWDSA